MRKDAFVRYEPRPRREISPVGVRLLRPILRFSQGRNAYVLRVVGRRVGPVLVRRQPAERRDMTTV
jgi:hypothetical protein